jgi:hypothetical protein
MKRIKFISILALLLTMTQGAWAQTYTATFATGSGETGWTINPASGVEGTSVTVSYSGENKVKSVTVKGISAVTSAPTANDLTYTGSAQALVTAGTATYGTMVYSLDGETYSDAIPTATNAGNYTVYYKVDGGTDYTGTTAQTVDVTITIPGTIALLKSAICCGSKRSRKPNGTSSSSPNQISRRRGSLCSGSCFGRYSAFAVSQVRKRSLA